MEKISKWFLSKTGRNFSGTTALIIACGSFGTYMLPHGLFIHKLQGMVQMYHEGLPKPLEPEVLKRAEQVLEVTSLTDADKRKIDFFNVYGFDMFSVGSCATHWGGIVGIPDLFSYQSVHNVKRHCIKLRTVPNINWSSDDGILFQHSMVFDQNAQKFGIAREIYMCASPRVFTFSLLAVCCTAATVTSSRWINEKFNLYAKKFRYRLGLYSATVAFGFATFLMMKDAFTLYYEGKADESSAKLGSDYLEGGIQFYKQILNRNKAIRGLMGAEGEKLYTANGNDNTLIRMRHVPFTARIDFLKDIKKKNND